MGKQHQHVVFHEPARAPKRKREQNNETDDSKKFWFSTRDIAKLAADGSDKKTKKKYELFQLMQAGARGPNNLKTPLPILRGMRQKHGERQARKREEEIAAGTYDKGRFKRSEQAAASLDPLVRAPQTWNELRQMKMERGSRSERSGFDVDGERGIRSSAGTFKNGVLYVNETNPLGIKEKKPRFEKQAKGTDRTKEFKGKFDKKFAKKRGKFVPKVKGGAGGKKSRR